MVMGVALVAEATVGAGLGTEGVEALGMESRAKVVVVAMDLAKPGSEEEGAMVDGVRVGAMAVAMGVVRAVAVTVVVPVEVTAAGVRVAAMEAGVTAGVTAEVRVGAEKEVVARVAAVRVAATETMAGSVGVVMVVDLEVAAVLGEVKAVAGTVGVPVEVTAAGVTAAAMAAEVTAVAVGERVAVVKVLAMAVVVTEAAMDLETLERGVEAERAPAILSIYSERTRKAKALASLRRGRGHSTCRWTRALNHPKRVGDFAP